MTLLHSLAAAPQKPCPDGPSLGAVAQAHGSCQRKGSLPQGTLMSAPVLKCPWEVGRWKRDNEKLIVFFPSPKAEIFHKLQVYEM